MNKQVEKDFAEMVANLLQTEFCPDWDPRLLHGFMGVASESGELLTKYTDSMEFGGKPLDRTNILIELSDLLHYMQMIVGVLDSSLGEVSMALPEVVVVRFHDELVMSNCEHLDPILLRGFMGIGSEVGELLNRYKKFMFYHGELFTRSEMLTGLSKLLHFMHLIITAFDSSLEELMCINIAKLYGARYKDGYSHDAAITHHRDKVAERAAIDTVIETFAVIREKRDIEGKG